MTHPLLCNSRFRNFCCACCRYLSKYDAEFFDLNPSDEESGSEVESEEEDFVVQGDETSEHDGGADQQLEEEAAIMP